MSNKSPAQLALVALRQKSLSRSLSIAVRPAVHPGTVFTLWMARKRDARDGPISRLPVPRKRGALSRAALISYLELAPPSVAVGTSMCNQSGKFDGCARWVWPSETSTGNQSSSISSKSCVFSETACSCDEPRTRSVASPMMTIRRLSKTRATLAINAWWWWARETDDVQTSRSRSVTVF